jgi:hypothetical protein
MDLYGVPMANSFVLTALVQSGQIVEIASGNCLLNGQWVGGRFLEIFFFKLILIG